MKEEEFNEDQEEELFTHLTVKVDPGQEPLRIDRFLLHRVEKISRNRIQNAITEGFIRVNGQLVKPNYKVRPSDEVTIAMPRDPSIPQEILPEDIPLDIVYEDDHLIVLNKQPGLVVHPGIGNYHGTLVNGLVYHLNKDLPVLGTNPANRPGLVHRLDKDTSGLMVTAKTEYTMSHLAEQFFRRTILRSYEALVWGSVETTEGTIEGHIGRHPTNRMQMFVYPEGDQGKHAVTHFKVLEDYYYVSLVKCKLETGRTHQIRVHMNYLGHPVFNDSRYGGNAIRKGTIHNKYKQFVLNCFAICPRQALHAKTLGFIHPVTEKEMYFESRLPDDMADLIEKWRNYYKSKAPEK